MSATSTPIYRKQCLSLLNGISFGTIIGQKDKRSIILPAFFARDGSKIFGLALAADNDKEELMDAEKLRLVANEIEGDYWYLLTVAGPSQQFPEAEAFKGERAHTWRLLQDRNPSWKGKELEAVFSANKKEVPICFGMSLEEVSGYCIESGLFQQLSDPR